MYTRRLFFLSTSSNTLYLHLQYTIHDIRHRLPEVLNPSRSADSTHGSSQHLRSTHWNPEAVSGFQSLNVQHVGFGIFASAVFPGGVGGDDDGGFICHALWAMRRFRRSALLESARRRTFGVAMSASRVIDAQQRRAFEQVKQICEHSQQLPCHVLFFLPSNPSHTG